MDLIRTVAIIMVLMYHALTEPIIESQLTLTQYSVVWLSQTTYESIVIIGVPLFVMLSGALLLQPAKVTEPIKIFFKKRLARIGLAFVFWSAIYFVWSYFADHTAVTLNYVIKTLLNGGAYYQFWFIYLIVGLYLITPVLRILVAYADKKILRYFIVLWFIGVGLLPLFQLITGFSLNSNVFVLSGYVGYFILGVYLIGGQVKTGTLKWLWAAAIVWTFIGTWLMTFQFHALNQYYFFFYTTSANVIVSTAVVFMLLSKAPRDWPGSSHPRLSRLVHTISVNTLPIFFLHVIVLESINRGYFYLFKISLTNISFLGFNLTLSFLNPIFEIPLATAVTLFISLGLVLLMKKVPVLNKLIG